MRWLLAGVIGLFVLWSGYWVVGSRAVLGGVQTWVADAPKQGLAIKTGEISLAGFPNRFDLTVATPAYQDRVSGWSWAAPFVQALALSYRPWEVIIALPNTQILTRPGEEIDVASDLMRASIKVFADTDLGLDKIILESDAVALSSSLGWTGSAKRAVVALRKDASQDAAYEFGLQIDALSPDAAFAKALTESTELPPVMDSATADVIAVLSAPLNRHSAQTRPEVQSIRVKNVLVTWGALGIHAEGDVRPDDQGLAEGRIDIRVTNWQHLVPLLVAGGAVKPELSQTAGNMLKALAQSSPDPDVLALPLTLKDGWMSLGPFPLGPAPSLRAQPGF